MARWLTIGAIIACYFVFAILLNSVGTVILQSINSFGISKPEASTLEGFKDLSIAIVSFFIASVIPRVGYKIALLVGLCLVLVACLVTPIMAQFWMIKLLFACIGCAFALVKVSVYALVGQLAKDARSHSSLLNTVEGFFMVGVLSGYWLFSLYINPEQPESLQWMQVYYGLAVIIALAALLVLFAPVTTERPAEQSGLLSDFIAMLKLAYQPLVLVFVLSIFMYVLIEQGIGTWLPTFNREVIGLPVDISVQLTSIFAACLAFGRLAAGQLLRWINWYPFLNTCLLLMAALILVSLPLTRGIDASGVSSVLQAPIAAYLLPVIGLLMAPIYPILNSVMLSALDTSKQASMTGLIVIFSALGGTTGSVITGLLFASFDGQTAFYMSLIPIVGIAVTLALFRKISQQSAV